MKPRIVIVFHSGWGHTARVAQAVAEGAGAELVQIDENGQVGEAGWRQLDAADAIVFGTPTYMGNVSWQFKRFADASAKVWSTQGWRDKLAAAFTNSAGVGGDKQSTLLSLFTLAQQQGMLWVGTGLMPANTKGAQRDDINYLASFSGLGTAAPSDATPDEMSPGDLATARLFGQRVAAAAGRLRPVL